MRRTLQAAILFIGLGCRPQGVQLSSGTPVLTGGPSVALTSDAGNYALDFGSVAIGDDAAAALTLENTGGSPLAVTQITPPTDGEFTLDLSGALTVPSGSQVPLVAHYAPLAVGRHSYTVVLRTDSEAIPQLTIVLSGEGEKRDLVVSPLSLDFGGVVVHTTLSLKLTLTNQSAFALTLTPQALQGTATSVFATDTPSPFTLQPGATTQITVTYAPLVASASDSSVLQLSSSVGSAIAVNLHGVALQNGLLITPQAVDFNFVAPGQRVPRTVHVKDIGNTSITLLAVVLSGGGTNPLAFSIPPGLPAGVSSERTLAPGQELDVTVTFAPRIVDFYSGQLQVTALDQGGTRTVPLQGFGGGAAIACAPLSIDFGTVAAGFTTTLPVVCTNTGTDVGGHPEAGLTLNGFTSSNPSFFAVVDPTSPAQPIAAGESLLLDLSYTPGGAENDTGNLTVRSNVDNGSLAPVITLSGSAFVEGPCNFALSPTSLNWGQTTPNTTSTLAVSVANLGPNECYLWNIGFAPGTDSAFLRLGDAPSSMRLDAPGGTSPTSLVLPVSFEAEQPGSYGGELTFQISDPSGPIQIVPLAAVAATSCVTVTPLTLDFGTVGFADGHFCQTTRRDFVLENGCASAATIETIEVSSPFAQVSASNLPLSILPGESTRLTLGFEPTAAGNYYATAAISIDLQQSPVSVFLHGIAVDSNQQVDSFPLLPAKIDVLWVVDTDDDDAYYHPSLLATNAIGKFFEHSEGIDYQVGVISTDTCAGSAQGSLEPCPTCRVNGNASTIVTLSDANPSTTLTDLINQVVESVDKIDACPFSVGVDDEQFFDATYLALQPGLLNGLNRGFLRDDALLAIITVNADAEDDYSPLSTATYLNFFRTLKTDPTDVTIYALNEAISDLIAPRLAEAVTTTGGKAIQMNNDPSWASSLGVWQVAVSRVSTLVLTGQPIPSTLALYLGGPPPTSGVQTPGAVVPPQNPNGTTNWTYMASTNSVDISLGLSAAAPGQTLYVAYTLECN